jgi:DNA replication licensing factor MCM5
MRKVSFLENMQYLSYFSDAEPGGAKPKCPMDPYVVVHHKSTFIDQQMLKLQEPHGMVPVGELPRHLLLNADRYLTGKVTPGMRVTITGIFDIYNQNNFKAKVHYPFDSHYV